MFRRAVGCTRHPAVLVAALVLGTGCSGTGLRDQVPSARLASGSASDEEAPHGRAARVEIVRVQDGAPRSAAGAGGGGWTTPPRPGELPPPRVHYGDASGLAPPAPPPATTFPPPGAPPPAYPPSAFPPPTSPYQPPPPPPPGGPTWSAPAPYEIQPGPYPPCPPEQVIVGRTWSGCRLPCEDKISMWHLRGVLGYAFSFGKDHADPCLYLGVDAGRTFCGCWGLDVFYRYNSGRFDRANPPEPRKDGGEFHHVGVKLTYERSLSENGSRWYWWAGIGPEYFWTDGYIDDDSGFGGFAEAGIGYLINQNFRVRAGVNVHMLWTDVTRKNPADDGDERLLWVLAPVIQLELDF